MNRFIPTYLTSQVEINFVEYKSHVARKAVGKNIDMFYVELQGVLLALDICPSTWQGK